MILEEQEIDAMSVLALAHMGDAVYELLVRRELCRSGRLTAGSLHKETIAHVSAKAQSRAARTLLPALTERESGVYKRGRNAHSHAAPKGTTEGEYHAATGLETLFGWLYLREERERIEELFALLWEEEDHAS